MGAGGASGAWAGPGVRARAGRRGQGLGLGQVHAPVGERAPRELTGLGRAQTGHPTEHAGHRLDHGTSAVDVELGHIFAGEAVGGREPQ